MSKLDLDSVFGDQELNFQCPGCGHRFPVKFRELSREGNEVLCPSCRRSIVINHTAETRRGLQQVNKSLQDLERTLKRLGK